MLKYACAFKKKIENARKSEVLKSYTQKLKKAKNRAYKLMPNTLLSSKYVLKKLHVFN